MKNLNNYTIWLTGLPCSGKTTIAQGLEKRLNQMGFNVAHLDGDDVRKKLNEDLGFSEKDREENIRRVSYVAQLFNEKNNLVIASFVSPLNSYRELTKKIIENLIMIYVKCSLEECEKRDVKGMYKKARLGKIPDFTGISSPFEEPKEYDLFVNTENNSVNYCINKILKKCTNI